jgi:hypothetical protein
MATVTVKINERSSLGKAIMDLLISSSKESNVVEFIEEKSPYNPEFVKKIKRAQKRASYKEIDPNDVWGSLGLK